MICLDENFNPVVQHDILADTIKVTSIDNGVHTYTCLLCNISETRDLKTEIILSDDIEVAFGGDSSVDA